MKGSDGMVLAIRWLTLLVFFAAVAVMLVLRSPAADTTIEGDRYFVRYKHLRSEITREQYEQNEALMWRNRASSRAAVAMFLSLFAFVGVEALNHGYRTPGSSRSARRRLSVIRRL